MIAETQTSVRLLALRVQKLDSRSEQVDQKPRAQRFKFLKFETINFRWKSNEEMKFTPHADLADWIGEAGNLSKLA